PQCDCGSLGLRACAVVDGKIRETPVLELRRFIGTGFRSAITEQFGLPYLFGSGELSEDSDTGPETNLGADCANFVVYALRRQGQRVPWSDPKRLREDLDLVTRSATPGTARISAEDLQRGVIVHLGTHVAAVMEDRQPVGILSENDLSCAAANWDCTISNIGASAQRYAFRAPTQSAQLLRRSRFRAMGLANNHALDFGTAALEDCAAHLVQEQIEPIGVGKPGGK